MNSGNKSSRYCRQNHPNQRAGPESPIAAASSALFSYSAPAAPGTICRRSSVAATALLAGGDSGLGPTRAFGQASGTRFLTCWDAKGKSICRGRSLTVPASGRFLGEPHRPEPHGSGEKRLQTPFDHRRPRHALGPDDHASQRSRRSGGHRLAGFHTADKSGRGQASFSPGRFPGGSWLWLAGQY